MEVNTWVLLIKNGLNITQSAGHEDSESKQRIFIVSQIILNRWVYKTDCGE